MRETRTVITDYDVDSDVQILAGREIHDWKRIMDEIREGHQPTALLGGIAGTEALPLPDPLGALTLSATEQALWGAALYSPMPLPWRQAPIHYELYAAGTVTTTATASPTMTLTPRWGTAITDSTLGATPSIVLTASQTACPWQIRGEVTLRETGVVGSVARLKGTFTLIGKFVTPANGIVDAHHIFGYTAATGDSSVAKGLFMGIVSTITTPSVLVEQIKWASWN